MEILRNEVTEANLTEVEFKLNAEEFEAGLQAAYNKAKGNIAIPGFRKGKAPRKMIEKQYGENVFFEDAVNGLYSKAVSNVIDELGLDVVDMPNIEVVSVSKEDGVVFKASFTVKPEVTINNYLGLEIEEFDKNVTDADIEKKLKELQDKNARLIDVTRAVERGDTAIFDFKGFCDDEAFEGGSADNFSLEIGSGRFIPGFEEQMIGKEIGVDFDVNVTFPEDYNAKELAGKAAVFKCKINELKGKELPEIDDEFAKDTSEFDTLDELKADISKKVEAEKERAAKAHLDNKIAEKLMEKMQADVPNAMYENRIDDMVRDWEFRNKAQGIKIDDYLKYSGMSMEQFREIFREPAINQVKLRLALDKIAEIENIVIDDDTLNKEYGEIAGQHGMDIDKVKKVINSDTLIKDMKADRALEIVKENIKLIK